MRPRFLAATCAAFIGVLLVGCGSKGPGPGSPSPADPGLVAWETVRGVLQHPRCQNCHPQGDVPLQGDEGRPHAQNVQRGPQGRGAVGMECTTCHGPGNLPAAYGANVPPGVATGWRMPTPELRLPFAGVASAELCAQVKDPARNGGLDAAALRHHLEDPLVAWGWNPGVGRTAIPVAREQFLAAWDQWMAAGASCPSAAP